MFRKQSFVEIVLVEAVALKMTYAVDWALKENYYIVDAT